jgi:light-regulated signal transduction histidine kinase (bacteriophytochrome)
MLIQALLAYARLGRATLRLERIDTHRLVGHILGTLPEAGEVDVAADMPTVVADRTQLGQVFQNLIGNAQKFVDADEPRVRVWAEREERAWRFNVADNGIGIDPIYAAQIFEPFERLHTREAYPGAGIGLSICRRAVERHGGDIYVAPGRDGGTVFSFTIPDR